MLRGPQTVGELRGRAERMYNFDDLEAVENTLNHLADLGMVKRLPRQSGSRESRFAHLLSGDVEFNEEAPPPAPRAAGYEDRVAVLERDLADLRREFEDFRRRFE
jgi:hypothetical protein